MLSYNIYNKMAKHTYDSTDVSDLLKQIDQYSEKINQIFDIYMNIKDMTNINIALYNNVPSMRTKIISKTKSYNLSDTQNINNINDIILNQIDLLYCSLKPNKKINKIYIVTDDKTLISYILDKKYDDVIIICNNEFTNKTKSNKLHNEFVVNIINNIN